MGEASQYFYAFFDVFFRWCGVIHPKTVRWAALVDRKSHTGHTGDFALDAFLHKGEGIIPVGQKSHDKQAAFGTIESNRGMEMPFHFVKHQSRFLAVQRTGEIDVSVIIIAGHILVANILEQQGGMNIGALLGNSHAGGKRAVKHKKAQAKCRGHRFGKTARIDDPPVGVKRLDAGNIASRKANFTVGVVFKNDDIVLLGKLVNCFALFFTSRKAGRVLKAGDGVNYFSFGVLGQSFF